MKDVTDGLREIVGKAAEEIMRLRRMEVRLLALADELEAHQVSDMRSGSLASEIRSRVLGT